MKGKYRIKTFESIPGLSKAEKMAAYLAGEYEGREIKVSPWIHNLIMLSTNYGLNLYIRAPPPA